MLSATPAAPPFTPVRGVLQPGNAHTTPPMLLNPHALQVNMPPPFVVLVCCWCLGDDGDPPASHRWQVKHHTYTTPRKINGPDTKAGAQHGCDTIHALHVQRWLFIRPPIRSLRSSTVTSHPSSASLDAAETPAIPAPITIAFFAFGIVFARTMHYD